MGEMLIVGAVIAIIVIVSTIIARVFSRLLEE